MECSDRYLASFTQGRGGSFGIKAEGIGRRGGGRSHSGVVGWDRDVYVQHNRSCLFSKDVLPALKLVDSTAARASCEGIIAGSQVPFDA